MAKKSHLNSRLNLCVNSRTNSTLNAYLSLMRPRQWAKNLFIFAPAFFAFAQYEFSTVWADLLVAFAAFCLLSSGVYVINDILDKNADKAHPSKKFRPIASGVIPSKNALIFALCLVFAGGGGATLLSLNKTNSPQISSFSQENSLNSSLNSTKINDKINATKSATITKFEANSAKIPLIFALYFVLNLAYSLKLKHIAILDIFIIATGFVLRLFVGAAAINAPLSHFIIITTFLLALFLALAKRRDEVLLLESGGAVRRSVKGYNKPFLDTAMGICATLTMVAYIFYSIDESVIMRLNAPHLYLTAVFVLLGIFRYMQLVFVRGKGGEPSEILLNDRFLQGAILAWIVSFLGLVWLGNLGVKF